MRISSFPPILPSHPTTLILGSMPGVKSLERQEYYGHRQNAFWKIMFQMYADGNVPETFAEKKALLLDNNIALWDVLAHCEREGSLDSNIRNQEENDIAGLLAEYPSITKVLFNGKKSHRFFVKKFGQLTGPEFYVIPSTSPAYTMAFEDKFAAWKAALSTTDNAR